MRYNIISTGSKGNAVVINDIILIDCGVSFKALNDVYKKLKIVLLTHEHSDHINKTTVGKLASERPTLRFVCGKWLAEKVVSCGVDKSRIDIVEPEKKYNYGAFAISPVTLYHDVPNCGYRVYMGGEKLFYATDTNTLEGISAKDYDLYMVEANYVDEEIKERIRQKEEDGKYVYEYGAMHAHLSKQKCDNFICENIGTKGRFIYLHGHEERQ